jgi:hypothetical protein
LLNVRVFGSDAVAWGQAIQWRASADIEDATCPSDDFVADTYKTIAESDLTADTNHIGLRLEPVAASGGAIEVNRQAGCEKRNRRLRKPLPCLAQGHIGQSNNQPAVCHAAPIAVVFRDADSEYGAGLRTPLQERTDTLEKAAGFRVSFETGRRLLGLSHLTISCDWVGIPHLKVATELPKVSRDVHA